MDKGQSFEKFIENSQEKSIPMTSDSESPDRLGENIDRRSNDQSEETYKLLSREAILLINENNPIWRRTRIGLLVAFWAIWVGLLIALILVVVLNPKCPRKPRLQFWQAGVGYALDPFAFKDSDTNYIGDLNGLSDKLSYITSDLGATFVVLTALSQGYYTNSRNSIGCASNFGELDMALGTMDDFKSLIRMFHKTNIKIVLPIDMSAPIITKNQEPNLFQQLLDAIAANNELSVPENLMEKIIDPVRFWIDQGADGILLKGIPIQDSYTSSKGLILTQGKVWSGTENIIKEIRQVLNSYSMTMSKTRALMVEPVLKTTNREYNQFGKLLLGQDNNIGAHLVFNPEFQLSDVPSSLLNRHKSTEEIVVAYPTGAPYKPRSFNLIAMVISFFVKGTPIIYYGSEIGFTCTQSNFVSKSFYPKGKTPVGDIHQTYLLPMPWDRSGAGFSGLDGKNSEFVSYIQACGLNETVISSIAAGRGSDTTFGLFQRLIKLKQEPSLLWGDYELKTVVTRVISKRLKLFVRRAPDFPAFVVAINDPGVRIDSTEAGSVLDLSDLCDTMRVRLVFPAQPNLKEEEEVTSSQIYIASGPEPIVYVFECAASS